MSESLYKQVRVLVLYDLPMLEPEDRKEYTKFRNNILKLGCYLVQFSVYAKVIKNEIYYKSFIEKLKNIRKKKKKKKQTKKKKNKKKTKTPTKKKKQKTKRQRTH